MGRSRGVLAGLAVLLFAAFFMPSGQAAYTCFGREATIVGTSENEVLVGTNRPDVIVGLGGADSLRGMGGDDRICGNGSNDSLDVTGSEGNDMLSGGPGRDLLDSDDSADVLVNDVMRGDAGNDQAFGGPGNDDIRGGTGDDWLLGGDDDDQLRGDEGDDIITSCHHLVEGLPFARLMLATAMQELVGEIGSSVMRGATGSTQSTRTAWILSTEGLRATPAFRMRTTRRHHARRSEHKARGSAALDQSL